MFYEPGKNKLIRCGLCRHNCIINDGKRGICAVRENLNGKLYSLNYGIICAEHLDPIEKKPLFHFMPGSKTYSIAMAGCNFACTHCQNYAISQVDRNRAITGKELTPQEIVQRAIASNSSSISYTYTEPTVFYEFAYDTARLAKEAGLKNIFVTNGYISREALTEIAPYLDAANIDLKGFTESFYHETARASLSEVLDSIIEYRRQGIWIEITTLIIPGLNDSESDLERTAKFIVENLGMDTPWHVSRFYPVYKMTDRDRTPATTLRHAHTIGISTGLHYVYQGNVPGEGSENTFCPSCQTLLIKRSGFTIESNRIIDGKCPECGFVIAGLV